MRWTILVALTIAGCQAEPRSASYFEAHPEAARQVVETCKQGAHRGQECDNARSGLAAVQADRRMELFKKSFE
jgi:hypothetical protein